MVWATVPEAAPTVRNHRATSCPPPISAKLPKTDASRLIASALACVSFGVCVSLMGGERGQWHSAAGGASFVAGGDWRVNGTLVQGAAGSEECPAARERRAVIRRDLAAGAPERVVIAPRAPAERRW